MNWKFPKTRLADSLLEHILLHRGVPSSEHQQFLQPNESQIHSANSLQDSAGAAQAVLQAIEQGKKIVIHGDYDVDGVCATAILWDFLYRKLEADVLPFIPSRFDEGYGLSQGSLDSLMELGAEVVITVDCGIKNADLIAEYNKKGLQFIVTDHHTFPSDSQEVKKLLNSTLAVVHPGHPDGSYPQELICGTNVAWKLCQAVQQSWTAEPEDPLLNEYIDLVALATVCDLMPLQGENRAIVALGLQQMRKTNNTGLKALLNAVEVAPEQLDTYHFGYVLGPRLNAAGRLDTAMLALRLLSTKSTDAASSIAQQLNSLNQERQQLTFELLAQAEEQVKTQNESQNIFIVHGQDWPEGIVGLIAGKLSEKLYRPVIAGSVKDGKMVASARSPKGFHLAEALEKLAHHLEKFGGHEQAAGFTLLESNIPGFTAEAIELASGISDESLLKELGIDAELAEDDLSMQMVEQLSALEPHGFGNPAPVLVTPAGEVLFKKAIGNKGNHIKASVKIGNQSLDVIHFNGLGAWQSIEPGAQVRFAGKLEINEWRGNKTLQFKVKDVLL